MSKHAADGCLKRLAEEWRECSWVVCINQRSEQRRRWSWLGCRDQAQDGGTLRALLVGRGRKSRPDEAKGLLRRVEDARGCSWDAMG